MTGPDHYKEAERLVAKGSQAGRLNAASAILAEAQVHATLALTAATALKRNPSAGMTNGEIEAWREVAGS